MCSTWCYGGGAWGGCCNRNEPMYLTLGRCLKPWLHNKFKSIVLSVLSIIIYHFLGNSFQLTQQLLGQTVGLLNCNFGRVSMSRHPHLGARSCAILEYSWSVTVLSLIIIANYHLSGRISHSYIWNHCPYLPLNIAGVYNSVAWRIIFPKPSLRLWGAILGLGSTVPPSMGCWYHLTPGWPSEMIRNDPNMMNHDGDSSSPKLSVIGWYWGAKEPSRSDIIQFSDQRIEIGHWMLIECGYVFLNFFLTHGQILGRFRRRSWTTNCSLAAWCPSLNPQPCRPTWPGNCIRSPSAVEAVQGWNNEGLTPLLKPLGWWFLMFFWWTIGCLGRICTIICTYIIDQPCIDIKRYTGSARHQQTIMVSWVSIMISQPSSSIIMDHCRSSIITNYHLSSLSTIAINHIWSKFRAAPRKSRDTLAMQQDYTDDCSLILQDKSDYPITLFQHKIMHTHLWSIPKTSIATMRFLWFVEAIDVKKRLVMGILPQIVP